MSKGSKWFVFAATTAFVGTMLAAGIPVRTHPLHPDQLIFPQASLTSQHRDLFDSRDFIYLATVVFLATPTGSNQTYTSDATWDNSNNSVECVGAGGSGGANRGGNGQACGGGGGSYSKITNFSFATPGTTQATYRIGSGGTAISRTTSGATAGNAGGATWFNDATDPGNGADNTKASAAGGGAGGASTAAASTLGGVGGATASSWGTTKNAGGRGGNSVTFIGVGSGAGGAGGSNAAGAQGVDCTVNSVGTTGGGADVGGTGAGIGGTFATGTTGTTTATAGGNGTKFDATHGFGGGGGGCRVTSGTANSGAGGSYGGGGGGAMSTATGIANSGVGGAGLIVVTWTPAAGFNRNPTMFFANF